MKKILLYIILFSGIFHKAQAQQEVERANTLFEKAYYADAIPLYEEALPSNKSSGLIKNLADAYYHTFNLKAAARWYQYLISNYGDTVNEIYYFRLSQSLKAIGEYDTVETVLLDFYKKEGNSVKIEELREAHKYLENVKAIGERFTIENSAFNTGSSEFGAMRIKDEVWYTATNKKSGLKTYKWNNENYLDIYSHPANKETLGDSLSIALPGAVNTKLHEGAFTLSPDGKTLYFTRNNFKNGKRRTDDQKVSNLKIYSAQLENGKWGSITELPFNSDEFSNEHPTLNAKGTKLYFASDRPGGFGSFDIYEVNLQGDNSFSPPLNLGATINTDKKEQFPFIAPDNTLYFSSNGHPGFGLLDVFVSNYNNGAFEKPDNLGLPVNGGYDDFSYTLNTDLKTGYFASNRPTGKGSDDIYSFNITKELIIEDCKQFITGIITDRTTTLPLSLVTIHVLDSENTKITSFITKADGAFEFEVLCETSYTIKADKDAYEANSKYIVTDTERSRQQDASMDLYSIAEKEKAAAIVLEKKLAEEKARAEALAIQKIEEEKKKKIRLAQEKIREKERIKNEKIRLAKLKEEEKIRIAQEKIALKERTEKQRIAEKVEADKALAKKIEATLEKETALVKNNERTIIETEEIHFDYSLWYLRRESRERLKTVIDVMKNNPGIIVEIGTHTDIRGNGGYNKDLSQKRADSAKDFLVKNGIESDRIVSKGYGESQPIVKCATEDACTEEDHEWNRRCEFVVIGWDYKSKTP